MAAVAESTCFFLLHLLLMIIIDMTVTFTNKFPYFPSIYLLYSSLTFSAIVTVDRGAAIFPFFPPLPVGTGNAANIAPNLL